MAVSMIPNKCAYRLLLHAAFVADGIWGDILEPARTLFYVEPFWYELRQCALYELYELHGVYERAVEGTCAVAGP